jgi:hypothetical protein
MLDARHRWAIAGLFVALAILALVVSETMGPNPRLQAQSAKWVRAKDGWQIAVWERPAVSYQPPLHPIIVAAFAWLGSTTALMAFPSSRVKQPR